MLIVWRTEVPHGDRWANDWDIGVTSMMVAINYGTVAVIVRHTSAGGYPEPWCVHWPGVALWHFNFLDTGCYMFFHVVSCFPMLCCILCCFCCY